MGNRVFVVCIFPERLQILHFVMYPYAEYALPMYSLDLVAFGVRSSRARCGAAGSSAGSSAALMNYIPGRSSSDVFSLARRSRA